MSWSDLSKKDLLPIPPVTGKGMSVLILSAWGATKGVFSMKRFVSCWGPRFPLIVSVIALSAGLLLWAGYTHAAIDHSSQEILSSEAEEMAMGTLVFRQVLAESTLSNDPSVLEEVSAVGKRLAEAAGKSDYQWEFRVIQDDEMVSAFCLPGGKVGIYTGILPLAQDATGLATVISHEIGHAIARHGAERMTAILLAELGQIGTNIALRNEYPEALRAMSVGYAVDTTIGIVLPYSRKQEFEADQTALALMAKAGYDPQGAVAFWERMEKARGMQKPPEYLFAHPTDEARIAEIKRLLP